jgi:hypothetical protein
MGIQPSQRHAALIVPETFIDRIARFWELWQFSLPQYSPPPYFSALASFWGVAPFGSNRQIFSD